MTCLILLATVAMRHDFFAWAGDNVAHEAYFNTNEYQLYPVKNLPKSSDLYRRLF